MSKHPGENVTSPLSIADRVTCLENDVALMHATIFRAPSDSVNTNSPERGDPMQTVVERLLGRIEDLERRLDTPVEPKDLL